MKMSPYRDTEVEFETVTTKVLLKELTENQLKTAINETICETLKGTTSPVIRSLIKEELSKEINEWNSNFFSVSQRLDTKIDSINQSTITYQENLQKTVNRVHDEVISKCTVTLNQMIDEWKKEEEESREQFFQKIDEGTNKVIDQFQKELFDSVSKSYGDWIDQMDKKQSMIEQRLENLENFKRYVERK